MENASEDVQGVYCRFDNGTDYSGPFKVQVDHAKKKIFCGVMSPAACDGNLHKLICDFKQAVGSSFVTYQTITIYVQSAPSVRPTITYGPNSIRAASGDSITLSLSKPYEENTQIVFDQPAQIVPQEWDGGTIIFNYLDENGEIRQTSMGSSRETFTTTKIWVDRFNPADGPEFSKEIAITYFGSLTINYVVEE